MLLLFLRSSGTSTAVLCADIFASSVLGGATTVFVLVSGRYGCLLHRGFLRTIRRGQHADGGADDVRGDDASDDPASSRLYFGSGFSAEENKALLFEHKDALR